MNYHVLNGDSLADKFPGDEIPGQFIVIREAFIEGPLANEFDQVYWNKRLEFISASYDADMNDYRYQFLSQLDLIESIKNDDVIYFWFEDDLFCITNLLFSIYFISQKSNANLYRIFPAEDKIRWSGFGPATKADLVDCFEKPALINEDEIEFCRQLWEAYVSNDKAKLKAMSFSDTSTFRYLPLVIEAHLDRYGTNDLPGRPQQTLTQILLSGKTNFYEIYDEFWKEESIYGFGDLQVYNMLKEMGVELEGKPE